MASDPVDIPVVSVVIPTRGRRPLLEQTIASVRAQTLAEWEALVVDDGSDDDTPAYLARVAAEDGRVRPMATAGGQGANVARNLGVTASRGRYVVFLDSDDLLEPDCLRRRAARLDSRADLDYTVNAMRCFRQDAGDADVAWNTMTDEDDLDRFLQMDGPWQTTGVTWRRAALDRVGGWDPAVLSLQDLDFHARALALPLRYEKVNAWDCQYRLPFHRTAITADARHPTHIRSHVGIVRRLLDVPPAVLDATPRRRVLLGGFTFVVATRCANMRDGTVALDLWRLARRRRVVGPWRYAVGHLILSAQRWPRLAGRLRWRLTRRWPATYRLDFRHTLFHAPLPPPASGLPDDVGVDVGAAVVPVRSGFR